MAKKAAASRFGSYVSRPTMISTGAAGRVRAVLRRRRQLGTFVAVRYHPDVRPAQPIPVQLAADDDRRAGLRRLAFQPAPTALIDRVSRLSHPRRQLTARRALPRTNRVPTAVTQHRRLEVVEIDDVRCRDQISQGKVRGGMAEPDQVIWLGPTLQLRPRRRPVPPEQRAGVPTDQPAPQSPDAWSRPYARRHYGDLGKGDIGRWRLGCAPLIEDHREKIHGTLAGQSSQHPVQPLPVPGPRRPGVFVGDDQDSHADRPSPPEQRGGGGGAE